MADNQCTMTVGQHLAKRADLPDRLEVARLDHRERLIESHRLALLHLTNREIGRAGQPHLAAGSEHINGVVVLNVQQHAVAARGLTQPVDLLAQRQQLLAGFLEGVHQLGVTDVQRIQSGFELLRLAGGAGTAQLLPQQRGLPAQVFDLGSVVVAVFEGIRTM